MDPDHKGPETGPQLEAGEKPRAPPVAKKPKPLPPKKPSLPAKPLLKKPEVQNGNGTDHIQQPHKEKPQQEPAQSFTPSSPKASLVLPKGSPRTSKPNRTPPPLPKHPPKGPKSRVPSERSIDNSNYNESDSEANDCDKNKLISTNTVLVDELTALMKKSKSFDDKTSDNGNAVTPDRNIINGSVSPKVGRMENHTEPAGPVTEGSVKVAPKVPLKPKPRPDKKLKEKVNEQSAEVVTNHRSESPSAKAINGQEHEEHQIGSSTWFVTSTEAKQDLSDSRNFDKTDNNQNMGSQNILKAFAKSSPKLSPKIPRKPLPRIPSKSTNPLPVTTDKVQKKDTNGSLMVHFSKGEDNSIDIRRHQEDTIGGPKDTYLESDKDHRDETETKDGAVFSKDVCMSVPDKEIDDSKPQLFPKPVPRRSIPSNRPVPTPRKRSSINRLSGSEDSFIQDPLMTSSVHNLSMDSDSRNNENEFLNVKERIVKAKSEENVFSASKGWSVVTGTIDISGNSDDGNLDKSNNVIDNSVGDLSVKQTSEGTVVNSFVKSRVVFSEKGEEKQYRVIDKSVVTSQSTLLESHKASRSVSPDKDNFVKQDNVSQEMAKDFANDGNEAETLVNTSAGENRVDESPDSLDDLLSDRTILEPSSLLNEIEEILSRSHKHLSLTRSGSSPEKRFSPLLAFKSDSNRCERSRSVDSSSNAAPVRPPRPRKEQRRVRAHSQLMYDSCGSDTESLPDTSQTADENLTLDEKSMTLGRAKPHPPKPKRHKLLKVQRSQSDITAMKTFVDKQGHKRQQSDGGPMTITDQDEVNPNRPKSWRKGRPSKKAPPPPPISPFKGSPTNLNMVVPVSKQGTKISKDGKKKKLALDDLGGTVYNSIQDDGICSSEGEHDYHEIPEDIGKSQDVNHNSRIKAGHNMINLGDNVRDRSGSPPKLPPRNSNNSMSFETSSSSSIGHEFDSMITSSVEDMSVSSTSRAFPKTSSPNVVVKITRDDLENEVGLGASPVTVKQRPPSGVSLQSDSGSGSHVTEHISSSESEGEDEKKNASKKERKLFLIVQEIASSERVFVDVLNLLNVDFRKHISNATESHGRPVVPAETLNRILDYLPQLQNFNEDLLKDLETRISKWDEQKGISDIFVKKGPFLKLYTSYIKDFETMTATLDEALKKYPAFQASVKEFEMSPRCASLALKHYMLKPIQRIPQYRLLLQDYFKHLPENSPEMKDTQTALDIVSEVAHHANENKRHGDFVQKMLEIQRSLVGQFEVIKPGRTFLKEGELMKLSRKEMQPRFFFLFNDVLLYTTPVATGYRLNNVLPLAGMKVSVSAQDEFKTEFSIISVQRSFTLHSPNLEERDDWVSALNSAIEENALKRNTFEAVRAGAQVILDKDFVLGCKAPLWIPDARVTMCMLCTCEFTVTWRRHHCRACGRVVCGNCSESKAPLRYLKYKPARVCDECFKSLKQDAEKEEQEHLEKGDNTPSKETEESSSFLSLKNGLLSRFQKIRRSGRPEKKSIVRPLRLVEVNANDEGASMSGYLNRLQKGKKWKRSWYLVKEKVLYTFKATQDTAAAESMVLLGYEVSRFTDFFEGVEPELLFQLSHSNTAPIVFRTDSATATEKWVNVMRESSVT